MGIIGYDLRSYLLIWLQDCYCVVGISIEGDDELLADLDVKVEPKRDEWMTALPPERKVRPSFNYGLVIMVNLIALAFS